MLDQLFFGNTLYVWLIFSGIVAASVLLGWIVTRIILGIGRRSKVLFIQELTKGLARFGVVIFILLGLRVALGTLTLQASALAFFTKAIAFGISIVVMFMSLTFYDVLHKTVLMPFAQKTDTQVDDHLLGILRMVVRTLLFFLGTLIAMSNAGFDIQAALAGLGIGGLAFALAAQDAVANLFGGVTVILEKPFKIGDLIEIDGIKGYVREIGLRTTVIEATTGGMIRLPNQKFTDNPIHLVTYTESLYRVENELILRYDTTAEKLQTALQIVKNVIESEKETDLECCAFQAFGEYGFVLAFEYDIHQWTTEQKTQFSKPRAKADEVTTAINLGIMQGFQSNGIKIALPLGEEIGIEEPGRVTSGVF